MFDFQNSPYWNRYLESLEDETDAGIIGFCEFLNNQLGGINIKVREVFDEMKSGDFCGCYDGDIMGEYKYGVDKFIELLGKRIP